VCGSFKSSLLTEPAPLVWESHITAVCSSFKSSLRAGTISPEIPHQCGSFKSSLLTEPAPLVWESHITAVCGIVQVLSTNEHSPFVWESHITAVCGIVQVLSTNKHSPLVPTSFRASLLYSSVCNHFMISPVDISPHVPAYAEGFHS
jgi:hypothetical protein